MIDVWVLGTSQCFTFWDKYKTRFWTYDAGMAMDIAETKVAARLKRIDAGEDVKDWGDGMTVTMIDIADAGINKGNIDSLYDGIDRVYALSQPIEVLNVPIIWVPSPNPEDNGREDGPAVLIDGWHRVYLALAHGIKALPSVLLSRDDAKQCLIQTGSFDDRPEECK